MRETATFTTAQAYRHCRSIAREQARNFYYAFITLPSRQRAAIYATYAFCRLCDDATDEGLPPPQQQAALEELRQQLERAYAGDTQGPVFPALVDAARTFGIPQERFEEIIAGVEMDVTKRRYQSFEELRQYCHGVASTVGLVCIRIFGYRDPRAEEYAVDLGLAMQITNILRDIPEDSQRDRVYLPQEDLARFGYREEELFRGVMNDSFLRLMAFEAQRARAHFLSGRKLLPLLPMRSRGCVAVLHGLYARILDRIEARGYDVYAGRISLGTVEKLLLTAELWIQSLRPMPRNQK